jgi:hypothetical protein
MSTETVRIEVLRALLRLARRPRVTRPATLVELVASVSSERAVVEQALSSLARQELVLRSGETVRLSLVGLAVAVAASANAEAAAKKKRTGPSVRIVRDRRVTSIAPDARVIPMLARGRRHHAA